MGRLKNRLPSEEIARAQADHRRLTERLRERVNQRVEDVTTNPPGYLVRSLGSVPSHHEARTRWQLCAHVIEDYRIHWDITDATHPLGTDPRDPAQRSAHTRATDELERLARDPVRGQTLQRARAIGR